MGANRKYWNWHHFFHIISHFKYFFGCESNCWFILLSWSGVAVQGSLVFNNEVQIVTLKIYWPCKVYFSLTQNVFLAAFLFTRSFGASGPLAVARLGIFFTGDDNTHFLLYYHYVTYIWVYFWMNPVSFSPRISLLSEY